MKGYWMVSVDVADMEMFKQYVALTPQALAQYGGRFLARAGEFSAVEGDAKSRNSIIEFPSYKLALDCWHSDAYQTAREKRLGGVDMNITIVEGC